MAQTIWKYTIEVADETFIEAPAPLEIMSLGVQHGRPVVWVLVDPDRDPVKRVLCVRGTGHPLHGNEGVFIGTVQVGYGLVWHIFHAKEEE